MKGNSKRLIQLILNMSLALLLLATACKQALKQEPLVRQETLQSEMTCPYCQYRKMETMPTDVCLLKYTCAQCKKDLFPKDSDCCVFCSYGSVKCPSKQ
jgi:hypothetical protein